MMCFRVGLRREDGGMGVGRSGLAGLGQAADRDRVGVERADGFQVLCRELVLSLSKGFVDLAIAVNEYDQSGKRLVMRDEFRNKLSC